MGSIRRFRARQKLRRLYRSLPASSEAQIRWSLAYIIGTYGDS